MPRIDPTVGSLAVSRRTMLKCLVALAAGLTSGTISAMSQKRLRTRTIPKSGEAVPVIGLGTYQTFDVGRSPRTREAVREVLRQFVATGGRVIDSSPMYGHAETVVGDLAAELKVQEQLFYATKVWTSGREAGVRQMKQSMQRMRTAKIDLMQIHNLVDWRAHIKTLYEWKAAGMFRYIGITHYTTSAFDDMAAIMKQETLDFIQVPYNILSRSAEKRLLPLATERGIAVLVNEPFEQGALFHQVRGRPLPNWVSEFDCTSWAQYFLKFIISHPAVTCPIPATSKPHHLADNMQAGFGRLPNATQRKRMVRHMENL
ncbi:MAG: aldo/keto reductase [Acidiferrobacterales bacterium]